MTEPPNDTPIAPANTGKRRRPVRALLRFLYRALCVLLAVIAANCLAVMTVAPQPAVLAAMLAAAVAGVILWRRRWLPALPLALVAAVVVWFSMRTPSHDRNWTDDVAELPAVTIEGDTVTIDNFRNFDRSPDGAYLPRWETRAYDLAKLQGIELIVQPFPWSEAVAHTMLAFDFGPEGRLVISIEARKERGERYGPLAGALRQFELIYTFVDERDAYRVRAFNGDQLYAYPTRARPESSRRFLVSLLEDANAIREEPRFYHIIQDNCTTVWLKHLANQTSPAAAFNPIIILNGRIARLLVDAGAIDTDLPYDEAKAKFRIDELVRQHADAPDFSERIRSAR